MHYNIDPQEGNDKKKHEFPKYLELLIWFGLVILLVYLLKDGYYLFGCCGHKCVKLNQFFSAMSYSVLTY